MEYLSGYLFGAAFTLISIYIGKQLNRVLMPKVEIRKQIREISSICSENDINYCKLPTPDDEGYIVIVGGHSEISQSKEQVIIKLKKDLL